MENVEDYGCVNDKIIVFFCKECRGIIDCLRKLDCTNDTTKLYFLLTYTYVK
jgi:hypothetical protein